MAWKKETEPYKFNAIKEERIIKVRKKNQSKSKEFISLYLEWNLLGDKGGVFQKLWHAIIGLKLDPTNGVQGIQYHQ